MRIAIGNKNYSSWSLRAWLALKQTGCLFDEVVIPLDEPGTSAAIRSFSAAGRVPVLVDGPITVWDSLAIIEYLAEKFPGSGLWPRERHARAHARAVVAEMHSGFAGLRRHLPMNIRRPPARRPADAECESDVARVVALWREARQQFGGEGDFLFGAFCAADAFFAPVVSRFETYQVDPGPEGRSYMAAVLAHAPMREWYAQARRERWVVPSDEVD